MVYYFLSHRILRQCWIHSASSHTRLLLHLFSSCCCCALLLLCKWRSAIPPHLLLLLSALCCGQLVLSTGFWAWPVAGQMGQGRGPWTNIQQHELAKKLITWWNDDKVCATSIVKSAVSFTKEERKKATYIDTYGWTSYYSSVSVAVLDFWVDWHWWLIGFILWNWRWEIMQYM